MKSKEPIERMIRPAKFPYLCNLCLTPVTGHGDHGIGECVNICDCAFEESNYDHSRCDGCHGTMSPDVIRIKTISLHQPWADLLVRGVKRYETRGWEMKHRGPLAIHAALKPFRPENNQAWFNDFLKELPAWENLAASAVERFDVSELKYGGLVGVVHVEDSRPTSVIKYMNPNDRMLGDYGEGRWFSRCRAVRRFPDIIPCRGAQGWFYTELNRKAITST